MPAIPCPHCGEPLDVPPELVGQTIRCGNCQRVIEPVATVAPRVRPVAREEIQDEPKPGRSMLRTVLVLSFLFVGLPCLGCCGGLGYIFYRIENPTWTRYRAPDGRFTVEFPSDEVTVMDKKVPNADGDEIALVVHGVERQLAQDFYRVSVYQFEKDKEPTTKKQREAMLNARLDSVKVTGGGNVVERSRKPLTMFGQPALELVADITMMRGGGANNPQIDNGRLTARVVILGDRMYTLLAAGKDDGPKPEKLERFFSSFAPDTATKK